MKCLLGLCTRLLLMPRNKMTKSLKDILMSFGKELKNSKPNGPTA